MQPQPNRLVLILAGTMCLACAAVVVGLAFQIVHANTGATGPAYVVAGTIAALIALVFAMLIARARRGQGGTRERQ